MPKSYTQQFNMPNGDVKTARVEEKTVRVRRDKPLSAVHDMGVPAPTMTCPFLGGPSIDDEPLVLDVLCTTCRGPTTKRKTYVVHQCEREDIGRCNPSYTCTSDSISDKIVSGVDALPCKFCRFNPVIVDNETRRRAKLDENKLRIHVQEFEVHQKSLAQYYGVNLTPSLEEIEDAKAI